MGEAGTAVAARSSELEWVCSDGAERE